MLVISILSFSLSCSDDGGDNFRQPEGQFRLVERDCFCGPPEQGSTEYWIFDGKENLLTIRIIDREGQVQESRELFYGRNGKNLVIGEGAEFVQKSVGAFLELTYLDDPGIADDELVVKLSPF